MKALTPSLPVTTQTRRIPVEVVPLASAFMAIAFAFGVLARESGLGLVPALMMSLLVYAGTAQVVALGMISAVQPMWVIVLVTLLINSRFLLMSSLMVEPVRHWKPVSRFLFAAQLTDETFALLLPSAHKSHEFRFKAAWIQGAAYGAWFLGTFLGFAIPSDSASLHQWGLDFALGAMMTSVLVIQIRDVRCLFVGILGGALSLLAVYVGLGWASTLLAAAVAPAMGVWMEKR
jgi:4-azaleucine resistance transporter AzlC